MSNPTTDIPAEEVFNARPTRRRNTRVVSTENTVSPNKEEQPEETTVKRTGRRARVEVTNEESKPAPTTAKSTSRRKPVSEQTEEAPPVQKPRRVVKKKEKEESKPSITMQLIKQIWAIYNDSSLDANAKKSLEKDLVTFESSYENRDIVDRLEQLIDSMNTSVWSTTKKKAITLTNDVADFFKAVDWGTAYSKANTKGKVQFETHEKGLNELLYSVQNGIANTIILNQLAKLYVLLNPDISVPLAEGEKRTPQSFVSADATMTDYLADIMDALTKADEEYNQKIDEKGGNKKHKIVFDPSNIPRQQISKIFKYGFKEIDTDDADYYGGLVDGLESDEKLLADTINYHERQKAAKAKAAKEQQ